MKNTIKLLGFLAMIMLLITACSGAAEKQDAGAGKTVEYSLTTGMVDGQMAFIGVGGGINGVKNPTLSANVGDTLKLTLTSGEGVEHDITFPDFNATSEHVVGKGKSTTFSFLVDKGGSFKYNCLIAGHREAGMEGKFEVTGEAASAAPANPAQVNPVVASGPVVVNNPVATGADVVRDPTDLPAPLAKRDPQTVRIDLE